MNVLVTGGAGYIGSHTCLELLESGYGVVVIDNLCNSNSKSLERVESLTGKKLRFYEGDVRDEALLRKIFAENEIEYVIHFAGLKAVGDSCKKPLFYYDNNLKVPIVLVMVHDLLYNLGIFVFTFLLRGRVHFLFFLKRIIVPEMLYTIFLTIAVYKIFYFINYRLMERNRKEGDTNWLLR